MNLRTLSDSEFLRYADSQMDDLTSSDVERELLRRLTEIQDNDAITAVLETEFSAEEIHTLAEAFASTNDRFSPDDLKEIFEFVTKFRAIAYDADDLFDRINTLINETQEK